jgi:hypothetical protein
MWCCVAWQVVLNVPKEFVAFTFKGSRSMKIKARNHPLSDAVSPPGRPELSMTYL